MKKNISHCSILFATFLIFIPLAAYAQDAGPVKSVLTNFLTFLNAVNPILIACAFLVFGWGVVKFVTAGGDPQKRAVAKSMLMWGVIGIFILASLYGIVTLLKTYIGIPANQPVQVPKFE